MLESFQTDELLQHVRASSKQQRAAKEKVDNRQKLHENLGLNLRFGASKVCKKEYLVIFVGDLEGLSLFFPFLASKIGAAQVLEERNHHILFGFVGC